MKLWSIFELQSVLNSKVAKRFILLDIIKLRTISPKDHTLNQEKEIPILNISLRITC